VSATTRALTIEVDAGTLDADLALPPEPRGIVVFAHGSGSSRRSPRNLYVASRLHTRGFGTLLFDLLTPREQRRDDVTRELRFDVPLLAARLRAATWAFRRQHGRGRRTRCRGRRPGRSGRRGFSRGPTGSRR
jgi:hypothetical protein